MRIIAAIPRRCGHRWKKGFVGWNGSWARDSMPGMMDTILNLGLNDESVVALAKATGNERFAWDCYRRFIQMYGDVVMGVQKRPDEDHEPFETIIHKLKHELHEDDVDDTKLG